jgi:hypothetical protein
MAEAAEDSKRRAAARGVVEDDVSAPRLIEFLFSQN